MQFRKPCKNQGKKVFVPKLRVFEAFAGILNYKEIWDLQNVPSPFISDIIEIAKIVFTCIYDEKRETANIETYCKKEACWTVVKNVEYHISIELSELLLEIN